MLDAKRLHIGTPRRSHLFAALKRDTWARMGGSCQACGHVDVRCLNTRTHETHCHACGAETRILNGRRVTR